MPHEQGHMSAEMEQCIRNCVDCHRVCLETISHCLQIGGPHAAPDHIKLLQDCVQICQTSADFMIRGSQFHNRTCGACAEICEACAQDCERLAKQDNDLHMQACADMCRKCAASCRAMAA
ncbi:MAG: uncharacterized protein JWP00_4459 [Chloroflexi bacterium]|jgi:hypothetical protein|nr:uncharacterized protein [Chloroflexota bacterium]